MVLGKNSKGCLQNELPFVAPYRPASNGLAERAVQTLKVGLKKNSDGSLETRLYRFLLTYHNTPQTTTGMAPSVLLNKRTLRTRLDLIRPCVEATVKGMQEQMKEAHDKKSRDRKFFCGDPVFVYNFLGTPKWLPGVIEQTLGPVSFRVLLQDGHTWRRHMDHIHYHDAKSDTEDVPLVKPDKPLPSIPPVVEENTPIKPTEEVQPSSSSMEVQEVKPQLPIFLLET